MSNHKLQIETGRYIGQNLELRLCNTCNVLEDEKHFITSCRKFDSDRDILFESLNKNCANFRDLENDAKFLFIMSNEDKDVLEALGTYVYNAFLKL